MCSEMITVAPTQVHKQYQRTFSYASQCFTVSKFNLGIILSSSIATVDAAQDLDVIVDLDHPSSHDVDACQLCVSRSILLPVSATSGRAIGVG